MIPVGKTTMKDLAKKFSFGFAVALAATLGTAATTAPLGDLRDSDNVVTDVSDLDSSVRSLETNALTKAEAETKYRGITDDSVYAAEGYTPFTWSSDTPGLADVVSAMGQPHEYRYESGYSEWYFDEGFYFDGVSFYSSYAYAPTDTPKVEFLFYGEQYDEVTGEYLGYRECVVYGTRKPNEIDFSSPVDKFARQKDVTAAQTAVDNLRNMFTGETKVLRNGGANELGRGWGYLQQNYTNDIRRWRIRAPRLTVSGWPSAKTATTTRGYSWLYWSNSYDYLDGVRNYYTNWYYRTTYVAPANKNSGAYTYLLTWSDIWAPLNWEITETDGVYGSDAVRKASYRLGLILTRPSPLHPSYVQSINVRQLSDAPMVYEVTPLQSHNSEIRKYDGYVWYINGGRGQFKDERPEHIFTPVDCPPVTNTSQRGMLLELNQVYTNQSYGYYYYRTNLYWYGKATGISVPALPTVSTNSFTIPVRLHLDSHTVYEEHYYTNKLNASGTGYEPALRDVTVKETVITNGSSEVTISVSGSSYTSSWNVYGPAYKLLNDSESSLYYDSALDCTFRIAVSNGCFYSVIHCMGDWRR